MTALMTWISPSTMHALGWALLHFLWQGTALAALAAAGMAICRRTSVRYIVGVATLALMLIAPVATFVFYSEQHSAIVETADSPRLAAATRPVKAGDKGLTRISSAATSLDAIPWLVEAWLLGVAFFSLRSAGGFFLLERERRRQSSIVSANVLEICYTLQDRLGIDRAIQYCECKWLQAPAVIGWFHPIVFLPVSALTGLSEDQLQAVIAHELAHIRRFDPFVNVFQVAVETLLFYHPAVWWLNKRVRAEREHCCDETAVAVCGNAVEYARALTLMEEWRSAPVFAMAANRGPLTERIVRVLGLKTLGTGIRSVGLTGSLLCLTAALAAGNALLGMTHPRLARASSLMQATPKAENTQEPVAKPAITAKPSAAQTASPAPSANPAPSGSSYIEAMKAAGLANPSIDELIALKTQGVTPEYVREMHDLGLHPEADGLVGLKVQGVTPEYIKGLRALGFNPDEDQIIGMKVQGVTADYVKGLKEVGIQADADDIVGLKVQGVTPEYVREMRAAGLKVGADDVVGLKVQGVTPAYVQGLRAQGFEVNSDDVVGMKVQGVTPEYIRDIRALGFHPSADEIVGMKVQGVTPGFIKALQAAGFKPSIDDIVGAKVQGITPEFIEEARKHGFQNLTIEKLIELKHLWILENKAEL
ncbi:MAG TPA: M56 family metallopeptidase [Candidatus Sulfotelmatobacter sp.]|nr:M56 family metallopeptidase [Candidatus Sulfotelmatobacter sp.]